MLRWGWLHTIQSQLSLSHRTAQVHSWTLFSWHTDRLRTENSGQTRLGWTQGHNWKTYAPGAGSAISRGSSVLDPFRDCLHSIHMSSPNPVMDPCKSIKTQPSSPNGRQLWKAFSHWERLSWARYSSSISPCAHSGFLLSCTDIDPTKNPVS